ncbi:MAG TPA: CRISPR-associated helicase Cas3', partial [Armatimonadetes bacterium]|nr:CRISPR-associated helicase Cas3' [Armatimonadota bacterium]
MVDGGLQFLKEVTDKVREKPKLKAIYTWLLSLIKGSDLLASRRFGERAKELAEGEVGQVLHEPPQLWDLPHDLERRVLQGKKPYKYQAEISSLDEPFVVLRAPCGRGKTEAALLWFSRVVGRGEAERLIFAMPTQVTSNAMRERLTKVFGPDAVGLYHGRSYLEHREIARLLGREAPEDEEPHPEVEAELAREENFLGEVMFKPVTVTTVDHLLYTFVHGYRQADFALGCVQTAAIVFDEVHYYDRKMLSELRELFRILREMGIPHLLMSGTLPDFLIDQARLGEYALVEDEEGASFTPFLIEKREEPLIVKGIWEVNRDLVDEILEGHERGLVQFVVLNTVRKAQEVYKVLREEGVPREEIELLHSRFCYVHRREKERRMMERLREGRRPLLLVSTQVIEVSLDISSDRMFTELAPMDALGQRAGRLNRGAKACDGHKLVVFRPLTVEGDLDYLPYKDVKSVVEATWEILPEAPTSYAKIKEWCDITYADYTLGVAQLPELFEKCTL